MAIRREKKQTIKIDDDYFIKVDELNWTLFWKHPITEKGKEMLAKRGRETKNNEVTEVIGYYGNLRECIIKYARHKQIDDNTFDTLKAYCDYIEKSNKETIQIITNAMKHK